MVDVKKYLRTKDEVVVSVYDGATVLHAPKDKGEDTRKGPWLQEAEYRWRLPDDAPATMVRCFMFRHPDSGSAAFIVKPRPLLS